MKNMKDKLKKINRYSYVLIGGHNNLYIKLRNMVSKLTHIEPNKKNINMKMLGNADYLIVCYEYLSHNISKKLYDSSFRDKMIYIKGTNINNITNRLREVVNE